MQKFLFFFIVLLFPHVIIKSQTSNESFISIENGKGKFPISASGKSTPIFISSDDWPGVIRAAKDLQSDIGKVTSIVPELYTEKLPAV